MARKVYFVLLGKTVSEREFDAFRRNTFRGSATFSIGLGIFLLPVLKVLENTGDFIRVALMACGIFLMLLSGWFWRRAMGAFKVPFNSHRTDEQREKLKRRAARNKGI